MIWVKVIFSRPKLDGTGEGLYYMNVHVSISATVSEPFTGAFTPI